MQFTGRLCVRGRRGVTKVAPIKAGPSRPAGRSAALCGLSRAGVAPLSRADGEFLVKLLSRAELRRPPPFLSHYLLSFALTAQRGVAFL